MSLFNCNEEVVSSMVLMVELRERKSTVYRVGTIMFLI